ncbi:MAG: ABC transporter substrate-binding protein, partial [Vulcanimicrobiaceae bacterium]
AKSLGYKRLALTGEDTALPKSIVAAVPELAKNANMEIVFNELYPHNASDYTAEVLKIKQSNPDLILAVSYFPDSVALLHALKQANEAPKELFFAIGPTEPNFYKEVGADANGVMSMSIWNAALRTQGNDAFVKAFKQEYNTDPDYHSALNFAALQVVAAAVANAKGVDNEKIRDFLATRKVQTVAGTYQVDSTGAQIGYGALILQWQGSHHYIVWPEKYAQHKPLVPFPSWSGR